jgi:2'-hydroxyisoflavone reductase
MTHQNCRSILILGGTGFIGAQQVGYALARGHTVTVFNRGLNREALPPNVECLIGDRERGNYDALRGRKFDVCIDNNARVPHWVRDAGAVLREAVEHYVLVSTLSVYASHEAVGQDETAARESYAGAQDAFTVSAEQLRNDMSLYGAMKALCEDQVQSNFEGRATILRPGLIVGPGDETDRFTYWPVRISQGGDILMPPANDEVRFIDVRDFAQWTIRIAEARTLGVFNAFGPTAPFSMGDMLAGIALGTQSKPNFIEASREFLAENSVKHWSDLPVWIDLPAFHRRSNARAIAAGLTFTPIAQTATDTLAWWREQPAARTQKLKAGLTLAREAALIAKLRGF